MSNHNGTKIYPGTVPDKLQPYNELAEQSALGSLLVNPDAIINLSPFLRPGDFFVERNAWIYEAISSLNERNAPADLVTVCDELERQGRLNDIGGPAYLTSLISDTPTGINAEHYGHIVERTAVMRRLIGAAGQIARLAYEDSIDSGELLARAEKLLLDITNDRIEQGVRFVGELTDELFDHLDRVCSRQGITGIPTGLTDFDLLLGGLQRSDMIIIAGRPGMGKTSLALQIAKYAAKHQGARSLIFSLEMSSGQLMQRLVASESGIPVNALRTGKFKQDDWAKLFQAQKAINGLPIAIDDNGLVTPQYIKSRAIRHHAKYGLDLIIIDHIQLMDGDSRGQNRHQEIAEMSRACKNIARLLNIPVIALSQLSRNVEYRADKRPTLADLRESGSLEADADVVAFIYRDDVYNPDTNQPNVAEIIIAKHRNGPTGMFSAFFKKHCTEFVDLAIERKSLEQIN